MIIVILKLLQRSYCYGEGWLFIVRYKVGGISGASEKKSK